MCGASSCYANSIDSTTRWHVRRWAWMGFRLARFVMMREQGLSSRGYICITSFGAV
jgi:hypothetical protein